MLSAGLVGLGWRRFAAFDLAACALWAGYAGLIGLVGGKAFADRPLHALLLAFGLAALLAALIETGRRLFSRRWGRQPIGAAPATRHPGRQAAKEGTRR